MMHLDRLIRRYTGEQQSLDDVVIKLACARTAGARPSWKDFMDEANRLTGGAAQEIADKVVAGGLLPPPEDFFAPDYVLEGTTVLQEDNGYDDRVQYEDEEIVFGLREDSNAAKAGLRNGDLLLHYTSEWDTAKSEDTEAVLKVQRGEEILTIRYIPRGKAVPCWKYVKK